MIYSLFTMISWSQGCKSSSSPPRSSIIKCYNMYLFQGGTHTKWDVWIWAPHYRCNNSLRIQSITAVLCHIRRRREERKKEKKKKKKEVDPSPRVIVFQRIRWQIIGHSSIAIDESWNDLLPLQQKLGRPCDDDGALWSVRRREEERRGEEGGKVEQERKDGKRKRGRGGDQERKRKEGEKRRCVNEKWIKIWVFVFLKLKEFFPKRRNFRLSTSSTSLVPAALPLTNFQVVMDLLWPDNPAQLQDVNRLQSSYWSPQWNTDPRLITTSLWSWRRASPSPAIAARPPGSDPDEV